MPNGDQVQFPDDMPADQIKSMILKKFPDAGQPSHEEVNRALGSIRQRLFANLNTDFSRPAASAPNPNTAPPNDSSYSPYKPADPQHMPNDAINPVGTDEQMRQAILLAGALRGAMPKPQPAAMPALPAPAAAPPPNMPPVNMSQMPTQMSKGMEWAQNMGQAPGATPRAGIPTSGGAPIPPSTPSGIPANPITTAPPLPGTDPTQAALLQAAVHGGAHMLGLGHFAKMLGL